MIQRIQTLYLLAALALMVLMLFFPFVEMAGPDQDIYQFRSSGLFTLGEGETGPVIRSVPLVILISAVGLLLLISIFLYRNRRLQMRLCVYSIILEFGLIGLGYYYILQAFRNIRVGETAFHLPVIFPVLSIIFIYLAFRAIRKDEILISSIDRIR
jgi:hypothetical protein